jgi:hypothetical protein
MARVQIDLDKFSPDGEFVCLRSSLKISGGIILKRDDPVPKERFTTRRLRQLYEARHIGRPRGYVFVPPDRRKPNYDGALAFGFKRAAERDARSGRASNLHLREAGDAADLRPRQARASEVETVQPTEEAPTPPQPVVQVAASVPATEPAPSYGLDDMGLAPEVEAAPAKKARAPKRKKRSR